MSETARLMLVDPPGREQRFYSDFTPNMKHGDGATLKAQRWLSAHRQRSASVTELASQSGLEPRTFLRRFTKGTGIKPREYQQPLQISRAREMLEFSCTGIDEIASRVGMSTSMHFVAFSAGLRGSPRPTIADASHTPIVPVQVPLVTSDKRILKELWLRRWTVCGLA